MTVSNLGDTYSAVEGPPVRQASRWARRLAVWRNLVDSTRTDRLDIGVEGPCGKTAGSRRAKPPERGFVTGHRPQSTTCSTNVALYRDNAHHPRWFFDCDCFRAAGMAPVRA